MRSSESESTKTRSYRFETLDWIRGLAALWVFAFHYTFSEAFIETFPRMHALFGFGHLGVPIFFVISGYCISAAVSGSIRRSDGIIEFGRRRFLRIYPTFWCSIAVAASIPFLLEFNGYLKTGEYIIPDAAIRSNAYMAFGIADWLELLSLTTMFRSFPEATSLQDKFSSINAVYWTLAIEVQFYAIATFGLIKRVSFPILVAAVTFAAFVFLHFFPQDMSGIFLPYWPMFACGVLLFYCIQSDRLTPGRFNVWTQIMLTAIALLVCWEFCEQPLWFCLGLSLLLWGLQSVDREISCLRNSSLRAPRVMVTLLSLLGAMSYSLYLVHGPARHLSAQLVRQIIPTNTILFDMVVIFITSLIAYAFFLLTERRFVRMGHKRTNAMNVDTKPSKLELRLQP